MDRFLRLILGSSWHYAKDVGWLFALALLLPLWQIVAGFGHYAVEVPFIGSVAFWKVLIIVALGLGYAAWRRVRWAGVGFMLCFLFIAMTGKSPTMQRWRRSSHCFLPIS